MPQPKTKIRSTYVTVALTDSTLAKLDRFISDEWIPNRAAALRQIIEAALDRKRNAAN